jgi:hypothetical protein
MPFKIWQHPQGEMTVNEYVRRLAEKDKKNIDELKRAALEKAATEPEAPSKGRKKKAGAG